MRTLLAALLAAVALAATAQSTERPRPPGTVPLEEPPPMPKETAKSTELEPEVTRRTDDQGQVIEEYRVHGRLYMQKVTPKHGRSYVLMDHRGDGSFTKFDNSIDGHLAVPQWVLKEF
jgi:uncharacterized protein DUF2782